MANKYVHIFGIPVDQLSFKLNVLQHIQSRCDEKQCMSELSFDDCDGTWIAVDKLEADHGQDLWMDD